MFIYVILFVYLLFVALSFRKNPKVTVIFMIIPLVLLTALRNIELGVSDTKGTYLTIFNNLLYMNFSQIFAWRGIDELFFFILYKIITLIRYNYQFVLFALCLPYFIAIARYIYKYSNNVFVSIIVFIGMYYLFSFYLIKQCIAMGILIISYDYIVKRTPLKFILCVLLATMVHKMSLVFLIAYPFANKVKFSYKNYIYILVCFIVARVLPNIIYTLIGLLDYTGTLIRYIGHGIYTTGESTNMIFGFLINLIILIYCHMFCNDKNDNTTNLDFNLMTLGCIFYSFSFIVVEFYRVSAFFSIFAIKRISNLNSSLSGKNKLLLNLGVCLVFILYFFFVSSYNYNANPYLFFWEVIR